MARQIPDTATAGLKFGARVVAPDHPAPGWGVTLHLRGPQAIDLTSTPDGDAHKLTATATDTADWTAGAYWYTLRATDGADVVELETGSLRILPDIVGAGAGYDGRSQNQIALEAINAVLANRATLDQERYRINNRELYRMSVTDLLKLRAFYAEQVRREQCGRGRGRFGRQIVVRFSQ